MKIFSVSHIIPTLLLVFIPLSIQAVTFSVNQDAFTQDNKPSTNFGRALRLKVSDSPMKIGFIEFDVSSLSGSVVQAAQLHLEVPVVVDGGNVSLMLVNGSWSEGTITANNQPSLGATILTFPVTASDQGGKITLDITDIVKDWVDGTVPNYGLALSTNNANVKFGTKEDSSGAALDVVINEVPVPKAISGYEIISNTVSYNVAPLDSINQVALCPQGKRPIGGGYTLGDFDYSANSNGPNSAIDPTGWQAGFYNNTLTSYTTAFTVFVICAIVD